MVSPSKENLIAFRISDGRHSIFDGAGAMMYGGRWNSPGEHRVIYGALSYAGAMLEILARVGRVGEVPKYHQYIKISVPSTIEIEEVTRERVPGWQEPDLYESRKYGDLWLQEKRTAVLIVPSVIAGEEKNILFNQDHQDFEKITASDPQEVIWDSRLFYPKK